MYPKITPNSWFKITHFCHPTGFRFDSWWERIILIISWFNNFFSFMVRDVPVDSEAPVVTSLISRWYAIPIFWRCSLRYGVRAYIHSGECACIWVSACMPDADCMLIVTSDNTLEAAVVSHVAGVRQQCCTDNLLNLLGNYQYIIKNADCVNGDARTAR